MNFTIDTILVNADSGRNGQVVFRNADTLGYMFINSGNCKLTLNNVSLNPGAVLKTFERGYVDMTSWRCTFDIGSACGTTNGQLTCLIYTKAK
jgi:hypothetical protein